MGRVVMVVVGLVGLAGCEVLVDEGIGEDGTVCAEARRAIHACGAEVPLLDDPQCAGPSRVIAECITEGPTDCESLADLDVELCLADAVGVTDPFFGDDGGL